MIGLFCTFRRKPATIQITWMIIRIPALVHKGVETFKLWWMMNSSRPHIYIPETELKSLPWVLTWTNYVTKVIMPCTWNLRILQDAFSVLTSFLLKLERRHDCLTVPHNAGAKNYIQITYQVFLPLPSMFVVSQHNQRISLLAPL